MGGVNRSRPPGRFLERQSDALLGRGRARERASACTERRLLRQGCTFSISALDEQDAAPPDQSVTEELLSLADLAGLQGEVRHYYILWVYGWSPGQIAARVDEGESQVRRKLRTAQAECLDWLPVSFREFSRHSIYRAPVRHRRK